MSTEPVDVEALEEVLDRFSDPFRAVVAVKIHNRLSHLRDNVQVPPSNHIHSFSKVIQIISIALFLFMHQQFSSNTCS